MRSEGLQPYLGSRKYAGRALGRRPTPRLDFDGSWLACVCPVPFNVLSMMPRLPLLVTQAPARLTSARAYRPRISASTISQRAFSSFPSRRLYATPKYFDTYTPDRIPNASWPYLYRPFDKMANLDGYFKEVDGMQDKFIERLREAVAIPSISSEDKRRPDVVKVCYCQTLIHRMPLTSD